jgi:hypothetical protein
MVGIERRLAADEGAARLGYIGTIPLGGVQALFLSVIFSALRNRHKLVSPTLIPCPVASAPRISCKGISEQEAGTWMRGMEISAAGEITEWLCRFGWGIARLRGLPGGCGYTGADTLRLLATQQMPARHEEIGERAGHEQAMSVLLRPR